MIKYIFGFFFMYVIVICSITYFLYRYLPFSTFVTYLANVDLIANVLSTNFPEYFKLVYNTSPESVLGYISYNIITLLALSGVFIYGLQLKLIGHNNVTTFRSMIVVSIVTFTLPTMLIPYLTKYCKKLAEKMVGKYIDIKDKDEKTKKEDINLSDNLINRISIIISITIALGFIFAEGFIIENIVHKHNFTAHGRRLFGKRHSNPLENLFK